MPRNKPYNQKFKKIKIKIANQIERLTLLYNKKKHEKLLILILNCVQVRMLQCNGMKLKINKKLKLNDFFFIKRKSKSKLEIFGNIFFLYN